MELKVDIGFDQLLHAIKKLPLAKINQLKIELSEGFLGADDNHRSDFQKLLLKGPTMSEEQYTNFKEVRSKISQWRTR